jgi:REP element-mobilizing transposase RayT
MTRPLRVDVKGGWYHVTARGTERRTIFDDARDHEHFLELLEEMSERYGIELHAYALMGNHYHLLIRAPKANASAAIQWLNVSYSVWFNKKRGRVGHVFQGRFGSVLIDGEGSWALNASVYIHLNPIRTASFGLGKSAARAESAGFQAPGVADVKRRLRVLRACRWSSFRAYAGYAGAPKWLATEELLRRAGGRKKYRRYVQIHVTRGEEPEGFEDLSGRFALGSQEFRQKLKGWVGKVSKEQPARKHLAEPITIERIIRLVEEKRGEEWAAFSERHGDWGRELVLYLARRRCGLTLRQIGEALPGRSGSGAAALEYSAVAKAAKRFESSLAGDRVRRQLARECLDNLSIVQT